MLSFYILSLLSQAVNKSLLTDLIKNAYLMIVAASLTSKNIISEIQSIYKKLITQKNVKLKITINKYLFALHHTSHFSFTVMSLHTLCFNSVFILTFRDVVTLQHHIFSNFSIFLFIHADIISMSHHNHYINNKLNSLYCLHCFKHISNNIS